MPRKEGCRRGGRVRDQWQGDRRGAMPSIEQVYDQIAEFARRDGVRKVTPYGSRARGTNGPRSDIDIEAEGCEDFARFEEDVQERLWSLLAVDLVDLDRCSSPAFRAEIARDGKVLYEEVR